MQQLSQNPEMIRNMMQNNPMLRNMMQNNPQALQQMFNPEVMQAAMQMQQAMARANMPASGAMANGATQSTQSSANAAPGTTNANTGTGATGATGANTNANGANPAANPFMNLFGGMPPANGANPAMNPFMNPYMGMMGMGMNPNQFAAAPNPAANPAAMNQQQRQNAQTMFANQLNQLNNMGFTDAEANISALIATGGNVQAAIDR